MSVDPPSDEVWCEVEATVENQRFALAAWLRRRGLRFEDQVDLLQDVKVRVANWLTRKARGLGEGATVVAPGLVWTAMKRLIIDRQRYLQRLPHENVDEIEAIALLEDMPSQQVVLAETVAKALMAVSESDASLIRLAYLEGVTHAELSQRFGVCLGTISRRINRILQQLRRTSEQQGGLHA